VVNEQELQAFPETGSNTAVDVPNAGIKVSNDKEEEDNFGNFGDFQAMEGGDSEMDKNEQEVQTFPETGSSTVVDIPSAGIEDTNIKEEQGDFGDFGTFQAMGGDDIEISNEQQVQAFPETRSSTVFDIPNVGVEVSNDKEDEDNFGDFGNFQTMGGDGIEITNDQEVQTFAEIDDNKNEANFDSHQKTSELGVDDFGLFGSTEKVETLNIETGNFGDMNIGLETGVQHSAENNADLFVSNEDTSVVQESFGTSIPILGSNDVFGNATDLFEPKNSTSEMESTSDQNDVMDNEKIGNVDNNNISDDDEDFGDFHDADAAQHEPESSQPTLVGSLNHNVEADPFGVSKSTMAMNTIEMDMFASAQSQTISKNENVETHIFGSTQPPTNSDAKTETLFGAMQPGVVNEMDNIDSLGSFQGANFTNEVYEADPFEGLQQIIPTDNTITNDLSGSIQPTINSENVKYSHYDMGGINPGNNNHLGSDVFGSIQPTIATDKTEPNQDIEPTKAKENADVDVFSSAQPISMGVMGSLSSSLQLPSASDNAEEDPFASIPIQSVGVDVKTNVEKNVFSVAEPMTMDQGFGQIDTGVFGSNQSTTATDNAITNVFDSTPLSIKVNAQKDLTVHEDEFQSIQKISETMEPVINTKKDGFDESVPVDDDDDDDASNDDSEDFGDFHDSSNVLGSSQLDLSITAAVNPSNSELFGQASTMNHPNDSDTGSSFAKLVSNHAFETGSEEKKVTDGYDHEDGASFHGSSNERTVPHQTTSMANEDPFKALSSTMTVNLDGGNIQLDVFGSANGVMNNNPTANPMVNLANTPISMKTQQSDENSDTDDDDDGFGEFHESNAMKSSNKEMTGFSLSQSAIDMSTVTAGVSTNIGPSESNDEDDFGDFHDSSMDVTQQTPTTSGLPFQNNMQHNNMNPNPYNMTMNNIATMQHPSTGFDTPNNFPVNNEQNTNNNFSNYHATPIINGENGLGSRAMNNSSTNNNAITDAFSIFD